MHGSQRQIQGQELRHNIVQLNRRPAHTSWVFKKQKCPLLTGSFWRLFSFQMQFLTSPLGNAISTCVQVANQLRSHTIVHYAFHCALISACLRNTALGLCSDSRTETEAHRTAGHMGELSCGINRFLLEHKMNLKNTTMQSEFIRHLYVHGNYFAKWTSTTIPEKAISDKKCLLKEAISILWDSWCASEPLVSLTDAMMGFFNLNLTLWCL